MFNDKIRISLMSVYALHMLTMSFVTHKLTMIWTLEFKFNNSCKYIR